MAKLTKEQKRINKALEKISQKVCYRQGWLLSYTGYQDSARNLYELQRYDERNKFKKDSHAIKFVVNTAIEQPRSSAAKAVLFLAEHSPNEIDGMFRGSVSKRTFDKLVSTLNLDQFQSF